MLADRLSEARLIVAHPDDEILWFSSVASRVASILVCFGEVPGNEAWSRGRAAAAGEYPLPRAEFIGMTESLAFQGADWEYPVETAYGLEVVPGPGTLPGFDAQRYRHNFDEMVAAFERRLQGVKTVITHNPWGEYGHEDHVQVYRAVRRARESLGFDLWYSNYCSERSYPLMLRHLRGMRGESEAFATDLPLARSIEALYRKHGCWTWPFDDYPYFDSERFMSDTPRVSQRMPGSLVSLNFVDVDGIPGANPSLLLRADRKLRRMRRRLPRATGSRTG